MKFIIQFNRMENINPSDWQKKTDKNDNLKW